jgi:hypothetical protein
MARQFAAVMIALAICLACLPALAQLNQNCTVSVLNRTVSVNPDGSWVLPNIPANFGPVKARATCIQNGVTVSGESDFFTVPANGAENLPVIKLGSASQIPVSLSISPKSLSFTTQGQTIQLTVTATYPDQSTQDVTSVGSGTSYTVSNPALATVSATGLMTAFATGTVVIQASNEGTATITAASITLSNVDSDGDGIPDDAEIRMGLDPHNPVDAQEDFDGDGLTNLQEYKLGTDIRNPDTDGDGIPDGLEVAEGTDPLDPNSFDLSQALKSFTVTPPIFSLTFNPVVGEGSQQLIVTGTLKDLAGTKIDLTSTRRRTQYGSSDLTICNFGAIDGQVFAGNTGTCAITVTNSGFSGDCNAQRQWGRSGRCRWFVRLHCSRH